jgi:hypothetical protein
VPQPAVARRGAVVHREGQAGRRAGAAGHPEADRRPERREVVGVRVEHRRPQRPGRLADLAGPGGAAAHQEAQGAHLADLAGAAAHQEAREAHPEAQPDAAAHQEAQGAHQEDQPDAAAHQEAQAAHPEARQDAALREVRPRRDPCQVRRRPWRRPPGRP